VPTLAEIKGNYKGLPLGISYLDLATPSQTSARLSNPAPVSIVGDVVAGPDGNDDRVRIERSPFNAPFIRLQPPEFFHILREKLGWGLPHVAKPTSYQFKWY
jgi:hypothetical protein